MTIDRLREAYDVYHLTTFLNASRTIDSASDDLCLSYSIHVSTDMFLSFVLFPVSVHDLCLHNDD